MQVNLSTASQMMEHYVRAGIVPLLRGSPGIGKSEVGHQLGKKFNLKLVDLRLSQMDITDLLGFPRLVGEKSDYAPMAHFPLEGDPIPEGYSGWLLFLDELTSAPASMQAAAYKLLLDRMVGSHNLHKNVVMIGAGNLETDNAIVEPMSTALQSRLAHIEVVVDHKQWLEWAAENGIHHMITSYINFKPGALYTFSPTHTDNTYGCPRTWVRTSKILKSMEPSDDIFLALAAGLLSEGLSREFIAFTKVFDKLPKIEAIVANPSGIAVPEDLSVVFATCGSTAHNINQDNAEALITYIMRLPAEFQVVCLREAKTRNKSILQHKAFIQWAVAFGGKWV